MNQVQYVTPLMSCVYRYWNAADFAFSHLNGVIDVTLGYAGGTTDSPTSSKIGDHSEAVRIVFNPQLVQYESLLGVYMNMMGGPPRLRVRRKRSAFLYHTIEQQLMAETFLANFALKHTLDSVAVDVEPAGDFFVAEPFQQKCFERKF
jgi:peptide-methionine (S)-S-oxide reductase